MFPYSLHDSDVRIMYQLMTRDLNKHKGKLRLLDCFKRELQAGITDAELKTADKEEVIGPDNTQKFVYMFEYNNEVLETR